ncbi:MAG TPA: SPFH domain-containing protein [Phycisphaerales bacterium]|jgi:regulator of protease activity HflC (stomatin/prohibitin superfamily)|nr:SPFH domain-containing protein [Phycisphaerales bacterium]
MSQMNAANAETKRARRAASVTLRQGGDAGHTHSVGDLMDPANKSLAEALRIAYRLLMVSIFVMLVLFAVSGFQQIGASEVGVRLTLGKIVARDLKQGLTFSWPQPFGDVLKVPTTDQTLDVKNAFFPNLTSAEEKTLAEKHDSGLEGGRDTLDPDTDGAVLTADGSIVHTRWQVTYRRVSDARSLERISGEAEERNIVMAAVRRGVIHAAATMTADEVLYDQPSKDREATFEPIAAVAKREAQKLLSEMDVGLEIKQFTRTEKMPPRFLIKDFSAVQTAQAEAEKERTSAEQEAREKLSNAAGEAAPIILAQIDRYGNELTTGKHDEAEATLKAIDDLMQRRPVTIDGKEVRPNVSGRVSTTLAEALQYKTSVVSKARSDAESFNAKLGAFRANPQVFLSGEWTDAYKTFSSRESVQFMLLPPGLERLVLMINRDPDIDKKIKMEEAAKIAEQAQKDREKKRAEELFQKTLQGTSTEGMNN